MQDKESPLHRPITKLKTTSPQASVSSQAPPKLSMLPTPPTKQPVSQTLAHKTVSPPPGKPTTSKIDGADDFSDFADFHSAPFAQPANVAKPTDPSTSLQSDDDKYAALRSLEFETDLMDTSTIPTTPPATQTIDSTAAGEDWADFEHSSAMFGDTAEQASIAEDNSGEPQCVLQPGINTYIAALSQNVNLYSKCNQTKEHFLFDILVSDNACLDYFYKVQSSYLIPSCFSA